MSTALPPPPEPGSRRAWVLALASLFVLGAVPFLPALSAGFIWDDVVTVVDNPHIGSFDAASIRWAFSGFHCNHTPLAWLSLSVERALWGSAPLAHHAGNLLLHALNAALLAALLRPLLGAAFAALGPQAGGAVLPATWLAAAAFAVHPARTEVVTWVTERRTLLAATFALLAIRAYVAAAARGTGGRLARGPLALSLACFAGSLLSKAIAVTLPAVLLLLDAYPLRRISGRTLLEKGPYAALAAAASLATVAAQSECGALGILDEQLGLGQRLLQMGYSIVYYATTVGRLTFSPMYERPWHIAADQLVFSGGLAVAVLLTALAIAAARRVPSLTAVWLLYLLLILPMTGIVPIASHLVADRYAYLATVPLWTWLAAVAVLRWRAPASAALGRAGAGAVLALLALWATHSWHYTHVWRDERTFWSYALERRPSGLAHVNLALLDLQRQDPERAAEHYAAALELAPTYGTAVHGSVSLLEQMRGSLAPGTLAALHHALSGALERQGHRSAPWYALGLVEQARGDGAAARAAWERSLAIKPDQLGAALHLGQLHLTERRPGDAERVFAAVTRQHPDHVGGWLGLGLALRHSGEPERAAGAFRKVLALDPAHAGAREALASLEERPGR